MNITVAYYLLFGLRHIVVKPPFRIVKETKRCYFTSDGRYLKSELGEPRLKSSTQYPYIEVAMVDASEEELIDKLSLWFSREAQYVKRGV